MRLFFSHEVEVVAAAVTVAAEKSCKKLAQFLLLVTRPAECVCGCYSA